MTPVFVASTNDAVVAGCYRPRRITAVSKGPLVGYIREIRRCSVGNPCKLGIYSYGRDIPARLIQDPCRIQRHVKAIRIKRGCHHCQCSCRLGVRRYLQRKTACMSTEAKRVRRIDNAAITAQIDIPPAARQRCRWIDGSSVGVILEPFIHSLSLTGILHHRHRQLLAITILSRRIDVQRIFCLQLQALRTV